MLHYTTSAPSATGMSRHQDDDNGNIAVGLSGVSLGSNSLANNSSSNDHNVPVNKGSTPWEYEEITIERGSSGLGFTVAGGTDNPHYKNDSSIYITRLIQNGPAYLDGRLKLEDIIVRVNDTELLDVKHSEAVSALKNSGNRVQLLIKRRKFTPTSTNNVTNNNNNLKSLNNHTTKLRHQTSSTSSTNNTPRIFTSTLSSSQITNQQQTPPSQLRASGHSGPAILRGSAQYSTTRESSTLNKAPKLKSASSSQSLQQTDEVDATRIYNSFRENISNSGGGAHSKSTSAIDFDAAKSVSRLPRTVILQRSQKGLGFNIVGGVAGGGTFISYIVPGGAAERSNKLHCGDQVLSVNGIDLRSATHEEAASALKQAGQTVKLVVRYRPEEYIKFENKINDLRERNMLSTGTLQTSQKRSLYARALFDYDPSKDSGLPSKGLPFKFGEILHITNASDDDWWQAKKVLDNGQDDTIHGIIPSKRRIEKRERARLKSVKFNHRNSSESTLDRRRKRFSFSKRFPFMKSRENVGLDEYDLLGGSQSNSRGILSTSSTTSINNNSERGSIRNFNEEIILSYEPVLQQDINYVRPVALYGPVKDEIESLREDLSCDERFYKMESIVPFTTRPPKEGEIDGVKYHFVTIQEIKRELSRHKFVEAGELNGHLYGTSIDSIREIAESGKYCLLNISPKALKRLHDASLYPIVIFIKPKSIEFLIEMNKRWSHEEAATAMDYANRLEQEFGTYFTATIQQDNPMDVLREVMNVIGHQSGPRIWIPTTFEALNVGY